MSRVYLIIATDIELPADSSRQNVERPGSADSSQPFDIDEIWGRSVNGSSVYWLVKWIGYVLFYYL